MMEDFIQKHTNMKVVGVGGAGSNAVSRVYTTGLRYNGLEFICINTDVKHLQNTKCDKRIAIGKKLTKGNGAGIKPEVGENAALENEEDIRAALEGADLMVLVAGMGGGTGTGAMPVIARIAKELDILVIGIAYFPFDSLGIEVKKLAYDGIVKIKQHCDTTIIIQNQKIYSIIDENTTIPEAYTLIDKMFRTFVQGLAEIIYNPGDINVDFADIQTTFANKGTAFMGIGVATGLNRVTRAMRTALDSKMLTVRISDATNVLYTLAVNTNAKMTEQKELDDELSSYIDVNKLKAKGGLYYKRQDDNPDEVVFTIIATGYDENASKYDNFNLLDILNKGSYSDEINSLEILSGNGAAKSSKFDLSDAPSWLRKK